MKSDYICLLIEGFPDKQFVNVCNDLAIQFRNSAIRGFPNMDYKYIRTSYSIDHRPDIWLNVFNMMHDVETNILTGSEMVRRFTTDDSNVKTVRIGITDLPEGRFSF
jgi:hypothetical protein